ncbi:phosphatases II [Gonapodya prolifera JEL478]|uniref:protein-tyrosine-phosphatase n=1 Tax=Gonapodya prolifera (strain JEL478) TaxID=1344416 RepID=A0A139AQD6_GONPJ|nr:phosphatases II [Gonapodya prolifera JEL478]|eukprot:KXS18967.1 phosphatases II [Gonapodya prolifera JEL478]
MLSWLKRSSSSSKKPKGPGPFQVVPNVFIGSVLAANDRELLRLAGITHILNLTGPVSATDPTPRYPDAFPGEFQYDNICLPDEVDQLIRPHFERAHAFIDRALKGGGRVLVHCEAGISRSAAFLASWLMRRRGMVLRQSLAVIKAVKPDIGPNAGFFAQLYNYELELSQKGVLPASEVPSIGLKEYLLTQMLEGPAQGLDKALVEQALIANQLDPNRTLEALLALQEDTKRGIGKKFSFKR